jgi:hypothetical protein
MKDAFDEAKKRSRAQLMMEAESAKKAFAREIKSGLGKQIVEELEQLKPPTKWQIFCKKLKKALGL